MNKERRAAIESARSELSKLSDKRQRLAELADETKTKIEELWSDLHQAFDDMVGDIESARDTVNGVKDDEQESFENMPESLQQSERGQAAEQAVAALEAAYDALGELVDFSWPDVEVPELDVLEKLDEADGSLEEAAGV